MDTVNQDIDIQGLQVCLNGKPVLKEISLQVGSGRFCTLLGPNGVGKTTLLRSVMGLIKPDKGRLCLLGRELFAYSRKQLSQAVSYVPQGYRPLFSYSVLDMVVMGRNPHLPVFQVPGPEDRAIALKALKDLGIDHLAGRQVHKISGGELQLVLLARGLVQNTALMLLDEPTSNLDFNNQRIILDTLKGLVVKRGMTVLVTMHDPNLALEYADDLAILMEGRIISQLKKEDPDFYKETEKTLQRVYGRQMRIGLIEEKPVVYWH